VRRQKLGPKDKMSSLAFSVLLFGFVASVASEELVKAGDFTNYAHGIKGEVFLKDEKTLVIKGFAYDGAGPDAFFWAGKSGQPSSVGTILPYPFEGKFYEYEDQNAPILERRFNGEEIVLTLPDDLKATDIKWLSVWCRRFRVNFGDMFFPEDLSFEDNSLTLAEPEDAHDHDHDHDEEESAVAEGDKPDELPPPLVEPTHNAHDPNRHDDDWKEDPDALSATAEAEAESSAVSFNLSFTASILAILGAYLF